MQVLMRLLPSCALLAVAGLGCDCREIRLVDDDGSSGGQTQGGFNPQGGFSTQGGFGPQGGFNPQGGFGGVADGGSSVTGPFCGDGDVDGGEECDGNDLLGLTCTAFGFENPAGLICNPNCTLDVDQCVAQCGNQVIEPGEDCDDGNPVSGDGCSAVCAVEVAPCDATTFVTMSMGSQSFFGTTTGAGQEAPGMALGCAAGASGPEVVYEVQVVEQGFLTAYLPSSGTSFDSVLFLRKDSCESLVEQVACHDNPPNGGLAGEVVSVWMSPGETAFVFVDGANGAAGNYELRLDLSRGGSCSDPVPITVEGETPFNIVGTTAALSNDTTANGCNGAGSGPDAVLQFTLPNAGDYSFSTSSSAFNTVTHARTSCESSSTEVDCDNPGGTTNSQVEYSASANSSVFVWVDGTPGQSGAFNLLVTP